MGRYTWVIIPHGIITEHSSQVLSTGPSGAPDRLRMDLVIKQGAEFRLLNREGEPRYSGYILGEYQGLEPLQEYGERHGCSEIQYRRGGRWETLDSG